MSLPPLAGSTELEARMRRTFTDVETAAAIKALRDVSAAVRRYCGVSFTAATTTARLKVSGGRVRLPEWPVTDVSAVEDTNGNSVLFSWVHGDLVQVGSNLDSFAFEPWRSGIRYVDVTYDHGYDEVPDDLVAIVCQVAIRVMGAKPEDTVYVAENIGDYGYRIGSAAAAGAVGLLPDERNALAAWRKPGAAVQTLQ